MERSPQDEIRLTCSLTLWERMRASAVLISQRWLSIFFASIWVAAGISLIGLYWSKGLPLTPMLWFAALACFLFTPLMIVIGATSAHFNKRLREPFTYTFNDTGIHVSAVTYEYTHKWAAISRVKRLGGFLMFFFSPGCAHCMPLHAVNAAQALKPLVGLARKHGVPADGT
jgi:hypothetical protein